MYKKNFIIGLLLLSFVTKSNSAEEEKTYKIETRDRKIISVSQSFIDAFLTLKIMIEDPIEDDDEALPLANSSEKEIKQLEEIVKHQENLKPHLDALPISDLLKLLPSLNFLEPEENLHDTLTNYIAQRLINITTQKLLTLLTNKKNGSKVINILRSDLTINDPIKKLIEQDHFASSRPKIISPDVPSLDPHCRGTWATAQASPAYTPVLDLEQNKGIAFIGKNLTTLSSGHKGIFIIYYNVEENKQSSFFFTIPDSGNFSLDQNKFHFNQMRLDGSTLHILYADIFEGRKKTAYAFFDLEKSNFILEGVKGITSLKIKLDIHGDYLINQEMPFFATNYKRNDTAIPFDSHIKLKRFLMEHKQCKNPNHNYLEIPRNINAINYHQGPQELEIKNCPFTFIFKYTEDNLCEGFTIHQKSSKEEIQTITHNRIKKVSINFNEAEKIISFHDNESLFIYKLTTQDNKPHFVLKKSLLLTDLIPLETFQNADDTLRSIINIKNLGIECDERNKTIVLQISKLARLNEPRFLHLYIATLSEKYDLIKTHKVNSKRILAPNTKRYLIKDHLVTTTGGYGTPIQLTAEVFKLKSSVVKHIERNPGLSLLEILIFIKSEEKPTQQKKFKELLQIMLPEKEKAKIIIPNREKLIQKAEAAAVNLIEKKDAALALEEKEAEQKIQEALEALTVKGIQPSLESTDPSFLDDLKRIQVTSSIEDAIENLLLKEKQAKEKQEAFNRQRRRNFEIMMRQEREEEELKKALKLSREDTLGKKPDKKRRKKSQKSSEVECEAGPCDVDRSEMDTILPFKEADIQRALKRSLEDFTAGNGDEDDDPNSKAPSKKYLKR